MPQNPEWVELYEYVKKEIMGYDETIKLPKHIIMRLQGLSLGQFYGNKRNPENAKYDYKTILITFKYCKPDILSMFVKNRTTYTDENHRFNAAMCIIDKEINNVVIKLKNAKKSEEKTIDIELENQVHDSAKYTTKSKELNKELEDLW